MEVSSLYIHIMFQVMVSGSRFTVLCALTTGRLQLLDLQHQEHPHMRSLPLLPPARPTLLAVHPHKPVLVVACQGTDGVWELRCMHAVTGKLPSTTETSPQCVKCAMRGAYGYIARATPPFPCSVLPCPTLLCPTLLLPALSALSCPALLCFCLPHSALPCPALLCSCLPFLLCPALPYSAFACPALLCSCLPFLLCPALPVDFPVGLSAHHEVEIADAIHMSYGEAPQAGLLTALSHRLCLPTNYMFEVCCCNGSIMCFPRYTPCHA